MREELSQAIEEMKACRVPMDGALLLKRIGDLIGAPRISATEDYSREGLILGETGIAMSEVFGWPREYIELSLDKRHTLASPIGHACRFATRPFVWYTKKIWEKRPANLDRAQERVLEIQAQYGVYGGITVPIHRPLGRVGSVGWTATDEATDLEALLHDYGDELMLIGHFFLDVVYQARAVEAPVSDIASLSEREIECLTWVALGKTDAEIAERIFRSPATARFHIEKAVKKLGAASRSQAAAMASQLGLIGPVV